jgi:hypothetical protein
VHRPENHDDYTLPGNSVGTNYNVIQVSSFDHETRKLLSFDLSFDTAVRKQKRFLIAKLRPCVNIDLADFNQSLVEDSSSSVPSSRPIAAAG